jgi:hypothetical protein
VERKQIVASAASNNRNVALSVCDRMCYAIHHMKTLTLSALLVLALALTGCGLAQAPLNMMSRMLYKGGNMMNMRAENSKTPDDLKLEPGDVKKALADGAECAVKPDLAGPELALH